MQRHANIIKRALAGVASLGIVLVATIAAAPASQAADCNPGSNETVTASGGDYKATFKHHGETLRVEDHNSSDGTAAVAYVKVYRFWRCDPGMPDVPRWYPDPIDEDRFVMTTGLRTYNLGTPDGSGDIAEGQRVDIMICRGYASNPGDNCSDWEAGVS